MTSQGEWKCRNCDIQNTARHRKCHNLACRWCPECEQRCPKSCGQTDCARWCDECNTCTGCNKAARVKRMATRLLEQARNRTCGRCARHGEGGKCPPYARDSCVDVNGCALLARHSWLIHKEDRKQSREDLVRIHGNNVLFLVPERKESYSEPTDERPPEQDQPHTSKLDRSHLGTHNWACEHCGTHHLCHREACEWCPQCSQRPPEPGASMDNVPTEQHN